MCKKNTIAYKIGPDLEAKIKKAGNYESQCGTFSIKFSFKKWWIRSPMKDH